VETKDEDILVQIYLPEIDNSGVDIESFVEMAYLISMEVRGARMTKAFDEDELLYEVAKTEHREDVPKCNGNDVPRHEFERYHARAVSTAVSVMMLNRKRRVAFISQKI